MLLVVRQWGEFGQVAAGCATGSALGHLLTSRWRRRNKARDAVDQAVDVLNRIHAEDPTVLPALIAHRIPCNEALADDPTVQVGYRGTGVLATCEVGLLGIINGLYGVQGERSIGFISADYDADHNLTHFERLVLK